jgi:hypothetical protein
MTVKEERCSWMWGKELSLCGWKKYELPAKCDWLVSVLGELDLPSLSS